MFWGEKKAQKPPLKVGHTSRHDTPYDKDKRVALCRTTLRGAW